MSVSCECCVLSGRGLCDELLTRPGESDRLWCVVVCDLETSWMRGPWPIVGCCTNDKTKQNIFDALPITSCKNVPIWGFVMGLSVCIN
jgi:hypothetical protein